MPNTSRRFGAAFLAAVLAALLLLSACLAPGDGASGVPDAVPVADCAVAPRLGAPVDGWRFRLDPDDSGLTDGWFAPDASVSGWARSAPGRPWEENGFPDYDGIAWYRADFVIPASWTAAYVGTVQVDDFGRIWIDGVEHPLDPLIPLPVDGTRRVVTIAYRIEDAGGYGGIKMPVLVSDQPYGALTGGDYARLLAAQNPDWPMPGWADGSYHAWTFTGALDSSIEAIISAQAAVKPWADAPFVELWLLHNGNRLLTPDPVFTLTDDVLPMPVARWQFGDLAVDTTFFTDWERDGTFWRIAVDGSTVAMRDPVLLVVVRPFALEADTRPIYNAGFDERGRLWVNSAPFLAPSRRPHIQSVGPLSLTMDALDERRVPDTSAVACAPGGDLAAVLAYPLDGNGRFTWTLDLAFPAEPGADHADPATAAPAFARTRAAWQAEVAAPELHVPDRLVMNAYRASLAYLLVALDPEGPHPGPLRHDALWVRDAAYIGASLLQLGYVEEVGRYIPSLFAYQREDGYVPAIIEPGVGPTDDEEWDAQGQLVYLIAEYFRYSGDREQISAWYPNVRAALTFLVELRARTAHNPPQSRGILPPSKSAEDLGSAEWHHYWDNFWAVAGLENGAFLAAELGFADDAAWMQAEADALRAALRASIMAVMGPEPAYIPNGPEDTTSSAMARGTSNSLYPVTVFERTDPLIVRSFDYYYERWIKPNGGIYEHIYQQWWPYGGLGLARDYVRLGRQDVLHQILGWTLANQTLPGTYAWAEQVSPATGGFSGGDMPHAWAASSFVTLIREMVVLREGDALEILAGVPGSWLSAGQEVRLDGAPTPFGPVSLRTESTLAVSDAAWDGVLTLTLDGSVPPDGFRWRLPRLPQAVDGPARVVDGWLIVPDGGTVRLTYDSAEP